MSYQPVSGIVPQYSTDDNELASGYYLKFYKANTTTPLSMATDSTGGTLLVKCKLSPTGFPISNPNDNSTVFIPHVNANYRQVIYPTETDADNNNTAAALLNVPSVEPLVGNSITTSTGTQTVGGALDGRVIRVGSVADISTLNMISLLNGVRIDITGYHPGSSVGGGSWFYSADTPVSQHNGCTVISLTVDWDGTQATLSDFLNGFGETNTGGTGCLIRTTEVDIYSSGIRADATTDDSESFLKLLEAGRPINAKAKNGFTTVNLSNISPTTTDKVIRMQGDKSIELVGSGINELFRNTNSIEISGVSFSEFKAVFRPNPSTLVDLFSVQNCAFTSCGFCSYVDRAVTGGFRDVLLNGNIARDIAVGFWVSPETMLSTTVTNNTFRDLKNSRDGYFAGTRTHGVWLGNSNNVGTRFKAVVNSNTFEGLNNAPGTTNENQAIMIHQVQSFTVLGNVIRDMSGGAAEGIYTRGVSGAESWGIVEGNTIIDCEGRGIVPKQSNVIVSGNNIAGVNLTVEAGIAQAEGQFCLIEGNKIDNAYYGIQVQETIEAASGTSVTYKNAVKNNHLTRITRVSVAAIVRNRAIEITGNTIKEITGGAERTAITSSGVIGENENAGVWVSSAAANGSKHVIADNTIIDIATDAGFPAIGISIKNVIASTIEAFVNGNTFDTLDHLVKVNSVNPTVLNSKNNNIGTVRVSSYLIADAALDPGSIQQTSTRGIATVGGQIDYYEEGVWSPSMGRTDVFGDYTAGANDGGKFTRIGNIVHFSCRVEGTNTTASGGSWVIRGLPFVSANDVSWGRTIVNVRGPDGTPNTDPASDSIRVSPGSNDILVGTLVSGSTYYASGFYFVS